MTIDERLVRLKNYNAGLDEQDRKEREESRRLLRETQREILGVSRKLNDLTEQFLESTVRLTSDSVRPTSGYRPLSQPSANGCVRTASPDLQLSASQSRLVMRCR